MKVRGLSAIVTTIILAVIVFLGLRYFKSTKSDYSNPTKNHLTLHTEEDLAKPTPRVGQKDHITQNLENHNHEIENKEIVDENLLAEERTVAEINEMTQSQFVDLLKTTEAKLPTIADIRKLPAAEVHHTPGLIMQAGRELGLIKEILKEHESFYLDASIFYEKCAKSTDRPKSIKALCLTNLIEIKQKNKEALNLDAYPKDLIEMSKLIIDI